MPLATLATYAWDDLSRRSTLSLGNGTVSMNSYNAQGSLASLTHDLAGTTNDLGFSYVRNQSGEIIAINPTNPQSNWMLANPPQSRNANGLNQYLAINSNAITHDANGNLQSDGLWAYSHDLDNRLVSAVRNNPASGVSLGYDPAGRLSRTVVDNQTTDLLYDGTDLIAEYDGAGNLTTRHIHGPGIDEPLVSITGTTKTWRYADHLGSVIAEADAAGNAVAIRGYGPFGENGSTAPNRFGYTGQQYIAGLGLYYYKARWYSPTMGRFLETDPIGYGDGVNWYAYVGNNPINFRDPRGLSRAQTEQLNNKLSDSGGNVMVAQLAPLPLYLNPWTAVPALLGTGCLFSSGCRDFIFNESEADSGNTNPYKGPVDKPVVVVDHNGNAIPVDKGQQVKGSPNGDYQQVLGADGKPTGDRLDRGGHSGQSDPRAQGPHGHRPGVTTPDGNPHLPINPRR